MYSTQNGNTLSIAQIVATEKTPRKYTPFFYALRLSFERLKDKSQKQDLDLNKPIKQEINSDRLSSENISMANLEKFFKEQQINLPEDRERVVEALKARNASKQTKHEDKEMQAHQR